MTRHAHGKHPQHHPREWIKANGIGPETPVGEVPAIVASWNVERKFGFLMAAKCESYFHITNVVGPDRPRIAEGVSVLCVIEPSTKFAGKFRARNIRIVEAIDQGESNG